MQNIIFYVSGAETLGVIRDYANAMTLTAPVLVRGVETCLKMRLFANHDGLDPYPLSAFDRVVAWQFMMDKDFDSSTGYILEADDANIVCESVTDTISGETITYTQFSIPIPNMNTEALVRWLSTEESKSGLNGELIGFDGTGEQIFVLQVKGFVVRGRISSMGEPSEIIPEYLTAPQVRALVASGVVFQFSSDGVNWHDEQTSGDIYYRQRSASSATSAWSVAILIAKGEKGESGKIITGAGEINLLVSGNTATLVNTITGGTAAALISDNAVTIPESFIGTSGRCEFSLLNSIGKNITTDPAVSRQWITDGYKVSITTGFTGSSYSLKPCGVQGEKGDPGRDGSEGFTAFEVLANDEAIPAGSTEYCGVNLGVTIDETIYGTAVEIPIGMEHEFKAWVISGTGVRVDWGDGSVEDVTAAGSIATCDHTYATAGKYLVKVYGDFVRLTATSSKNLIYRVLDEGLPLALHHNSLQNFAINALRLVAVDVPGWGKCAQIESLLNTFSGCKNLRCVYGLKRIPHLVSCNSAFKDCHNMIVCEFRLPPVMLNQPGSSDAYRAVFYSSSNTTWQLTGELADFFPDAGFAADFNDLSQLFYNYRSDVRFPNLTLSENGETRLGRVLWYSHKRFVYRSASDEEGGKSGIFRCFSASVRAKIPVLWGGTNETIEVDEDTGSQPEYQGGDGISIDGGTISVKTIPYSYEYLNQQRIETNPSNGWLTLPVGQSMKPGLELDVRVPDDIYHGGLTIWKNGYGGPNSGLAIDIDAKIFGGTMSLSEVKTLAEQGGGAIHAGNGICFENGTVSAKIAQGDGLLFDTEGKMYLDNSAAAAAVKNDLRVYGVYDYIEAGEGISFTGNTIFCSIADNGGITTDEDGRLAIDTEANIFGGTASLAKYDNILRRFIFRETSNIAPIVYNDESTGDSVGILIDENVLRIDENRFLTISLGDGLKRPEDATGVMLDVDAKVFGGTASLADDHEAITGKQDALTAGDCIIIDANNYIYVNVLAGSGASVAELLWNDFEFCCSVMNTIREDILDAGSGYHLYTGTGGVAINGSTISLSADRLATYNESYINLQGGAGNVHPDSSLVVGANTVTDQATHSVVCGGSNNCSNSYSFMFGYQLTSSSVQFQTVVGRSNKQDSDAFFIVGNGTSSTARSNAFAVKKNGNGVLAGDLLCNGGSVSVLNLLSRIEALEAAVAKLN